MVFRRPSTAVLERSAAKGGGKPPGTAAQVTPPKGIMHAWCLYLELFEVGVGGVQNEAYCADSISFDSPGPKNEITCVICR